MKLLETGPSPRGWHRLQLMLECPQKWAYEYRLKDRSAGGGGGTKSVPLIKGSMMHLALAHHYMRMQSEQQGTDIDEWLPPIEALEAACRKEGRAWQEHFDSIASCYREYALRWADESMKIVAVEKMAYAKIGEHLFTGRFDLVYEDRRGMIWICDHKTTTRLMGSQKRYYRASGQLVGYAYMGREIFGDRFAGMVLNQVQHKPPCKFQRITLPPAPNLMLRFPATVEDAEGRIAALEAEGRPYTQWPMAMNELTCYTRYGACPHLEKCQWGDAAR